MFAFQGSCRRIPMLGQPTPSSKGVFCTFWDKHGLMWVSQTGSKSKPWQRSLIIFMQGILLFVYQNTIFSCKLWTIGHCASLYYRRVAALIGNANDWNQTIWCESFQNDFIRHIPKYLYIQPHLWIMTPFFKPPLWFARHLWAPETMSMEVRTPEANRKRTVWVSRYKSS